MPARECSRTACLRPAVSTLTFVYADSTAVLGPLSAAREPHSHDLCREHSAAFTAPRGWRLIRLAGPAEGTDDLVALADAVRSGGPRPAGPAVRTDISARRASADDAARAGEGRAESPRQAAPAASDARHLRVVKDTGATHE